jgi:hypothetical protein
LFFCFFLIPAYFPEEPPAKRPAASRMPAGDPVVLSRQTSTLSQATVDEVSREQERERTASSTSGNRVMNSEIVESSKFDH